MILFLDSAITDEIKHGLEVWDIDGVTTNPRHVKESGKPFEQVIEEIAALVSGTDKPVSVEVNPHLVDWEKIVEQGLHLASLSPNFVIKVSVSEPGYRAIRELRKQGARINATLIHSVPQAWHAARCGATYVSPFIGWREAHGDSAKELIQDTATMLKNYNYPSKIIASAIRNGRQIADALVAGAHVATAGFAVYADSFNNPYTTMGEEIFKNAWDSTPKPGD